MAKIERFEDIAAWQRARSLVKEIYSLTAQGQFARDFELRSQLRRAAVSIMSNIAEGFERGSNKEFRHFLHIAKGSAGEVRSLLYVALDSGYINEAQQAHLTDEIVQVSNKIAGFIRYLDGDIASPSNGTRTLREDETFAYDPNLEP
jgi:four helix bundle protein